ncbi:MAG: YihY/virulence factor BrkB family protein [Deltaproteobacteria bacterium]|nr:YihY/virulence factor BrkB family protein [Deltaproteobacteria bacterium]
MKYLDYLKQIWGDFNHNNGLLWATVLTYTTLFSLVPLLAVALSLFKAFGGFQEIQKTILMPMLTEILDPTHKIKVMAYIQEYIDKINAGTLGIIGTSIFILTFIPLFMGMERAINHIWKKVDDRPIWLKFVMYWAVTTLGPLAIVLSLTLFSSLNRIVLGLTLIKLIMPVVIFFIIFSLFIIYKLVPNTNVENRPALIGAGLGGILWIIANLLYQTYMSHVTTSFSIYGSLGAIPVFLLWIYISWVIILFGVQVSRFVQYPLYTSYKYTRPAELLKASISVLELLISNIKKGEYLDEPHLCKEIGYPPETIGTVLDRLKEASIICTKDDIILPNKATEEITMGQLLDIFIGDIDKDITRGMPKGDISSLNAWTNTSLADILPNIK